MKHAIYPEKQGTPTATSADANYPVTNLTDNNYRKKLWKAVASVQTATITVPISANASVISLHNTNASSATVVAKDHGGIVVKTTNFILSGGSRTYDRFWFEYATQTSSHTVEITLSTTATTVEAGIVRAGTLATFSNPQYGANQSPRDFSIKKQLRNGAVYTKKLEIVRAYSYSMDLVRDTKFNDLIDLYNYYGPDPFAMLIDDEVGDDNYWCLFGAFDSEPQGSHSYPSDSVVSISLLEAV